MWRFTSLVIFLLVVFLGFWITSPYTKNQTVQQPTKQKQIQPTINPFPLAISNLQSRSYPGSNLKIEQTLADGNNYHQYIVSYQSDGLKIYGLLTVPIGDKPINGWPAVLFNHGYIPPNQYQTAPVNGQYTSYVAAIASNGYIVFKPDYRGNGNSQGDPQQSYVSAGYIVDDLNALASLKKYNDVNQHKIGIWAHSMGGNIALHDLVVNKDIKAAVIWSGVVGSYPEILKWWQHRVATHSISGNDVKTAGQIQHVLQKVGTPQTNPSFWQAIDPTNYLQNVSAPVQFDVGLADQTAPPSFSINLANQLKKEGKIVEIYEYPGNDHNLAQSFSEVMQHTLDFFAKYLK